MNDRSHHVGDVALPSLKALRAVRAVAAAGGFAPAAARLGVTRSAVSHLVADLERQLGVRLFERRGRDVRPTETGQRLIAAVDASLTSLERAFAGFRREGLELRLSTLPSFAQHWLIPRLPSFHAAQPGVRVAVATSTALADFEAEDVDCAVRHGLGDWADVDADLLFRETAAWIGPPGRTPGRASGDVAEALRDGPFVAVASRPGDPENWWRAAGLDGAPPEPTLSVETRAQAIAAVAAGAGLALVDPRFLARARFDGQVVLADLPQAPLETGFYFVAPRRMRNRRFVALLRAWLLAEAERENALPE